MSIPVTVPLIHKQTYRIECLPEGVVVIYPNGESYLKSYAGIGDFLRTLAMAYHRCDICLNPALPNDSVCAYHRSLSNGVK